VTTACSMMGSKHCILSSTSTDAHRQASCETVTADLGAGWWGRYMYWLVMANVTSKRRIAGHHASLIPTRWNRFICSCTANASIPHPPLPAAHLLMFLNNQHADLHYQYCAGTVIGFQLNCCFPVTWCAAPYNPGCHCTPQEWKFVKAVALCGRFMHTNIYSMLPTLFGLADIHTPHVQ
jgi:hypothetical protein